MRGRRRGPGAAAVLGALAALLAPALAAGGSSPGHAGWAGPGGDPGAVPPACLAGAGEAALCPALGPGVVASCVAHGVLLLRGAAGTAASAAAAIRGDDTSDWDAAYRPEVRVPLGLDFALRVRGARAECAAESHLRFAGEHGFRRGWGVGGAAQVVLEHGFLGNVLDLRGPRLRAFAGSEAGAPWAASAACAVGEAWDPWHGELPCPAALAMAPGAGPARVRVGASWGPVAVPGTGLVAAGGSAVHLEFPDGTQVHLGYAAAAVRPLAGS